jgi:hypothetical protein
LSVVVLRILVPLLVWMPLASPAPDSRLVMKDGTVYLLKDPPQVSGGRLIFTTVDGKVLSARQDDVQSIGAAPRATPSPTKYNPQDSRALGAIARQQRDRNGRAAEVAPSAPRKTPSKSSASSRKAPKKTPTPKPASTPKPAP